MKPPTTLNGHSGLVRRPHGTRFLNYEGELAVVIGKTAQAVAIEDALEYVAGYAPANDVGVHDFRHADRGAMLRVKGQDGFLPIGPGLAADHAEPGRRPAHGHARELAPDGRAPQTTTIPPRVTARTEPGGLWCPERRDLPGSQEACAAGGILVDKVPCQMLGLGCLRRREGSWSARD
jgi:hypothetical protein